MKKGLHILSIPASTTLQSFFTNGLKYNYEHELMTV